MLLADLNNKDRSIFCCRSFHTDSGKPRADFLGTIVAISHIEHGVPQAGDVQAYSPQQEKGKTLTVRVRVGLVEEVTTGVDVPRLNTRFGAAYGNRRQEPQNDPKENP
jgi:hypothetical protein